MAGRLPRAIQEALDRLEPRMAEAFLAAIQKIKSAVRLAELEAAIARGDIDAAIDALRLEQGFFGPLYEAPARPF